MVRLTVLASGSKGNSAIVASSRTRILLDAGMSCRELFRRMREAGEDPGTLDAILITHEHQDHVQGLAVTARRLGVPVYFTEATHRAWIRWMTPKKTMTCAEWLAMRRAQAAGEASAAEAAAAADAAPRNGSREGLAMAAECAGELEEAVLPAAAEAAGGLGQGQSKSKSGRQAGGQSGRADAESEPAFLPGVEYFRAGADFSIGDIEITPFTIPHDAADPCGFVFRAEGIRMAVATDLGYMPANVQMHLRRADLLMIESNHDLEMLRDGPYPWSVKQRVLSRVGHLSNEAAAEFFERTYDGNAHYVVLAHLSESNNLPELARVSAERGLRDHGSLLGNRLLLAEQARPLAAITF